MLKWISIVLILAIISCSKSTSSFNGFEKMLGSWKAETKSGIFYENWKLDGNRMIGNGLMVKGTDTLFGEKLIVEFVNDKLVYIADVKGQNPVMFTEDRTNDPSQFFNPEHDFPNHISYGFWPKNEKVTVILEGVEDGNKIKEELVFTKITNE